MYNFRTECGERLELSMIHVTELILTGILMCTGEVSIFNHDNFFKAQFLINLFF